MPATTLWIDRWRILRKSGSMMKPDQNHHDLLLVSWVAPLSPLDRTRLFGSAAALC